MGVGLVARSSFIHIGRGHKMILVLPKYHFVFRLSHPIVLMKLCHATTAAATSLLILNRRIIHAEVRLLLTLMLNPDWFHL